MKLHIEIIYEHEFKTESPNGTLKKFTGFFRILFRYLILYSLKIR